MLIYLQTEVNYLGQLRHPNLVKLIGYCTDGDNRLLVYEFMPKGSLENHLFRSKQIKFLCCLAEFSLIRVFNFNGVFQGGLNHCHGLLESRLLLVRPGAFLSCMTPKNKLYIEILKLLTFFWMGYELNFSLSNPNIFSVSIHTHNFILDIGIQCKIVGFWFGQSWPNWW